MSVLTKLSFLFSLFFTVSLFGCDSDGSSGNDNGGGNEYSGGCLNASVDGSGDEENYPLFLTFDSRGATLSHTTGRITFNTVTSAEIAELKEQLDGFAGFTGISDGLAGFYTRCNVEDGMHARIEYDLSEADEQLVVSLFGNGGFIPNRAKFEGVFKLNAAISSSISFFYVGRSYNENMRPRFDDYIALHDANGYGCNKINCGTDNPKRWFNAYDSKSIDWHIDYSGN